MASIKYITTIHDHFQGHVPVSPTDVT